jgi:hypothetical protein
LLQIDEIAAKNCTACLNLLQLRRLSLVFSSKIRAYRFLQARCLMRW